MRFGNAGRRDEGLHRAERGARPDLSETTTLGFHVPEREIAGAVRVWFHPVLESVSAAVLIWQGAKGHALEAEHFDYRSHLPYPAPDVDDYQLGNGLHLKVIEPLARIQVDFAHEPTDTRLALTSTAIMPAAVPAAGRHFVQAMRNDGELVLRGERHPISGFYTRERSWGRRHSEAPQAEPPRGWLAGVLDDGFAFHVRMPSESPGADPDPLFGYVRRAGETFGVVDIEVRTELADDRLSPAAVALTLEDSGGASHAIRALVTARLPWSPWPNVLSHWCQLRLECAGRVGHGELQRSCDAAIVRAAVAAAERASGPSR